MDIIGVAGVSVHRWGTVTAIRRTVDRLGRDVTLTDLGWAHIPVGHDDMSGREAEVRFGVGYADFVNRDADRGDRERHYRTVGPGGLLLKVVVEYGPAPGDREGLGVVITAYRTGVVKPMEHRRWP